MLRKDRNMKKAILLGIGGLAASCAMLALGFVSGRQAPQLSIGMPALVAPAVAAPMSTVSAADKAQIEAIIHDYLVNNPEVMLEVQDALEKKQREKQKVAQKEAIKESSAEIFNSKYDGLVGNPDGKVTIVEFFDYNCHFCRGALKDMQSIVAKEKDVRFVLKEFPILGPDSQKASVVSMAFKALMPEKYSEFHQKLLGSEGRADEARAIKIALSLGANEAALRKAMQDPKIGEAFSQTFNLADKLAITGTPAYVVGKEVLFGALGRQVLDEKLADARACKTADNC
jgi:protein-disulfide isomerase